MKKTIIVSLFFVGLGFLLGEIIFSNKISLIEKLKNRETYYFLQEGVYNTISNIENNLSELDGKKIDYKNQKYHVYVGITKDKEVAELIQKIYEEKGYKIFKEEVNLSSEELSTTIDQYDLLIHDTKEESQILMIEKIVLAHYEEIMKKQ